MSESILQTFSLSKRFGDVQAVDGIDLEAVRGEVFGFLGPNGAGKTTTIGMILGLIRPTNGRIQLFGQPMSAANPAPLRQVGTLMSSPTLYPYLSGRDNLKLLARLYPEVGNGRIETVLDQVGMSDAAKRKVKGYSTGMKQRLGLASAILHQPQLLILDEPTNGLDPAGMREIRYLLRQLAADGLTVFLSSHLLHEVQQICDRVAILHNGKIVTQGRVQDLLNSQNSVRVTVDDVPAALEVLNSLVGVEVMGNGRYLNISGSDTQTIVAHLTENGIIPTGIQENENKLEDLFLSLTK